MKNFTFVLWAALILSVALPLSAQRTGKTMGEQQTPSNSSSNEAVANEPGSGANRAEPCWKAAGISPSAMQQRRGIEQNAKQQIASVCADSSLSADQRAVKIKEIHQQAEASIQALITPQQQEALKACRAEREQAAGKTKPAAPTPHVKAGPCGEPAEQTAEPATAGANSHKYN